MARSTPTDHGGGLVESGQQRSARFDVKYRPSTYVSDPVSMANFNTDILEYWEFSPTGVRPIEEWNDAYRLGVNYILYGMTH